MSQYDNQSSKLYMQGCNHSLLAQCCWQMPISANCVRWLR